MTELADPGVNPVTGKEGKGTAEGEEVLALDSTVYEELKAAAIAAKSRSGSTDVLGAEKEKLDAFLYREARLLDDRPVSGLGELADRRFCLLDTRRRRYRGPARRGRDQFR
jgi:hypothetical protein